MTATPSIVGRAQQRAMTRRERFVPTGAWPDGSLDLVADAAVRGPDRVAVADRSASLTYRELDQMVDRAASTLARQGVAAGDAVLLAVQNDIASVVAIHAALRAGAIALIAPTTAGRAQLADIVEQAHPKLALAPEALLGGEQLPNAGLTWSSLASLDADGSPVEVSTVRPAEEPSIVIYTSGTTSRPKGVVHSLSTMLAASHNYIDGAELDGEDRLFVVSPLASITGMLQCITVPVMLGAQVVLETKWDPVATCDLLLECGGTFFGGPDLLLDRLLDEVEARGGTETTIGAVYLGGTMLDTRILERVENQFGIVVMRAYGSSEAPISTLR